jgi:hypothetical protein
MDWKNLLENFYFGKVTDKIFLSVIGTWPEVLDIIISKTTVKPKNLLAALHFLKRYHTHRENMGIWDFGTNSCKTSIWETIHTLNAELNEVKNYL